MKTIAAIVILLGTIGLALVMAIAPTWLMISLVASGVKSVSKDCSKTYGIEKLYINGDFFCGETK